MLYINLKSLYLRLPQSRYDFRKNRLPEKSFHNLQSPILQLTIKQSRKMTESSTQNQGVPQSESSVKQESQSSIQIESRKRIHYTPQLKLQLIRLCIENGERFLAVDSEDEFWRDIQVVIPIV